MHPSLESQQVTVPNLTVPESKKGRELIKFVMAVWKDAELTSAQSSGTLGMAKLKMPAAIRMEARFSAGLPYITYIGR